MCVYSASTPVDGLLYVQIVETLEIEGFCGNGLDFSFRLIDLYPPFYRTTNIVFDGFALSCRDGYLNNIFAIRQVCKNFALFPMNHHNSKVLGASAKGTTIGRFLRALALYIARYGTGIVTF